MIFKNLIFCILIPAAGSQGMESLVLRFVTVLMDLKYFLSYKMVKLILFFDRMNLLAVR